MHEMSLAQGVMQIVEDYARAEQCQRVTAVILEIGQLAGVEAEALRFCFEAVTRDTVAQGAELRIVALPGQGWCLACSETVAIGELYDACPRCGGFQVQPCGGTEMRVKELVVV
jgi:hydrogenase nickel incorporation protein HypA/HybF